MSVLLNCAITIEQRLMVSQAGIGLGRKKSSSLPRSTPPTASTLSSDAGPQNPSGVMGIDGVEGFEELGEDEGDVELDM